MKIALISFLYESTINKNAARIIELLTEKLLRAGNDVTVITSGPKPGISIEYRNGIKIFRLFPKNFYWVHDKDRQPAWKKIIWQSIDVWNPFVFHDIKGILKTENPDIVHVHKLRGLSPSVWDAARSVGIKKIVHSCHDYELLSPVGLLTGKIGKWAKEQNILLRPYQTIRKNRSKNIALVTSPSSYTLNLHTLMGFFPNADSKAIPNTHGCTRSELASHFEQWYNQKRPVNSPVRLLYLGRLDDVKGVRQLCRAVKICEDQHLDIDLDIVGWGPLENELRQTYGECKSIRFHGALFGDQKNRFLQECDVLVVPSTAPEVFGIVITEAYAFGKPVIASRVGGIPEIVDEGRTGFLIEPGSIQELVDIITVISKQPARLEKMHLECFQMSYRFSLDTFINNYQEQYRLLESNS